MVDNDELEKESAKYNTYIECIDDDDIINQKLHRLYGNELCDLSSTYESTLFNHYKTLPNNMYITNEKRFFYFNPNMNLNNIYEIILEVGDLKDYDLLAFSRQGDTKIVFFRFYEKRLHELNNPVELVYKDKANVALNRGFSNLKALLKKNNITPKPIFHK